jgi:hypothetical protein
MMHVQKIKWWNVIRLRHSMLMYPHPQCGFDVVTADHSSAAQHLSLAAWCRTELHNNLKAKLVLLVGLHS